MRSRPLLSVLKNQQTFGGAGTWDIRNKDELESLVREFSSGRLRKLFSQVTPENHYLKPGSILLSDRVKVPIGDYGLTFFACEEGNAIFLGASEQEIDSSNAWIGSTIDYENQASMQQRFTPIMYDIAKWLHSYGYYGPVGADILETCLASEETDPRARMYIVDLNVRTTGSMCLPLLRTYFTKRGFTCSSSFIITTQSNPEDFIEHWATELQSGRMCILSWYHDREAGVSLADIAIGGKGNKQLQKEIKKIREQTNEVKF